MPKGYRDGTFGFGLTVGIFSALFAVVSGEHVYDLAECITNTEYACRYAAKEQASEPEWWNWARRFVAAEDTLAQWVMAGFTIVAAFLLWLTLRQANKTNAAAVDAAVAARDAVSVAEDASLRQTRAYIVPRKPETVFDNDEITIKLVFENIGATPAREFECGVRTLYSPKGTAVRVEMPRKDEGKTTRTQIGRELTIKQSIAMPSAAVHGLTKGGTHDMYLIGVYRYRDAFRKIELWPKVGDGLLKAAYHGGVEAPSILKEKGICHYV